MTARLALVFLFAALLALPVHAKDKKKSSLPGIRFASDDGPRRGEPGGR